MHLAHDEDSTTARARWIRTRLVNPVFGATMGSVNEERAAIGVARGSATGWRLFRLQSESLPVPGEHSSWIDDRCSGSPAAPKNARARSTAVDQHAPNQGDDHDWISAEPENQELRSMRSSFLVVTGENTVKVLQEISKSGNELISDSGRGCDGWREAAKIHGRRPPTACRRRAARHSRLRRGVRTA